MSALTVGSLFSGIGGLELGVEHATGGRVVFQVERDAWCRDVLAKHWPDAVRYDDVCTVNGLPAVDLICGGFPCQDVSLAGKRAGFGGERSSLWREYRRIIADVRPRFVFVENVPGLLTADDGHAFAEVLGDLAALGFDAEWDVFRASDVGAPHRRERIFLLAYLADPIGRGRDGRQGGSCWDIGDGEETRWDEGTDRSSDGGAVRLAHGDPLRQLQPQGSECHVVRWSGDGSESGRCDAVGNAEGRARQRASSWDRGHAAFASEGLADSASLGEREPADEGVALAARGRARMEPRGGGESPVADAEQREGGQRRHADVLGRRQGEAEQTRVGGGAVVGVDQVDPNGERGAERDRGAVAAGAEHAGASSRSGRLRGGAALARLGLSTDGLPRRLDAHRWPAGRGEAQHEGEPPRTAAGVVQRAAQLKAYGNAVVPAQAALAWRVLYARATGGAA